MNVAPSTAAPGTCGRCSSSLVAGQRYCVACGERRAELPAPFRVPERAIAVQPRGVLGGRRSFGAVGAVVLASGVLIGAAVGPVLTPASLASAAGQLIVVATGGEDGPSGVAASATGAGGLAGSGGLTAPTGNVATPPSRVVDLGGGGSAQGSTAGSAAAPGAPAAPPPPATTKPAPDPPAATPEEAPTVSGTVVHLSHGGHGYAVATSDGQLIAFHASKPTAQLGDKLKVTVRALQNGTFLERSAKTLGHVKKASFHGTVTFADAQARTYTVSAPGVSLLVHLPPPADPAAQPAPAPAAQPPAVGTTTTVDVRFEPATDPKAPPTLEETGREDGDLATGELDLEGIVRAPDPTRPADPTHLVVSADDAGESPSTLSLLVPSGVDVSTLKPGAVISALVEREADGSLTLVSYSDDSDRRAADRPTR